MDYLEIKAPAKINFGLNVISKRDDGYHNIETIFYPLNDLYDVIKFSKSEKFVFSSNKKDLENNHNLIIKAKNILEKELQKKINVKIELIKKIPVGAGLGGGSSDASATLLSLNEMFGLKFEIETLKKFALQLGSDVPFFINPNPSFAEGRGENITLVDFEINLPILIVNPHIHISTKEAYQNITAKKQSFNLRNITKFDFSNIEELKQITNDFEDYVFRTYPKVKQIKEQLYSSGAKFALMTGSGSTVFGIFENIETIKKAKKSFPSEYFTYISYSSHQ
jgi:4-diphosphocytidyl-2-C-methyl-D-erythritol kinase